MVCTLHCCISCKVQTPKFYAVSFCKNIIIVPDIATVPLEKRGSKSITHTSSVHSQLYDAATKPQTLFAVLILPCKHWTKEGPWNSSSSTIPPLPPMYLIVHHTSHMWCNLPDFPPPSHTWQDLTNLPPPYFAAGSNQIMEAVKAVSYLYHACACGVTLPLGGVVPDDQYKTSFNSPPSQTQ